MRLLSLPSTLEEINTSSLRFGDGQGECSITYAGSTMDWLRILLKSEIETTLFATDVVTCTDGEVNQHFMFYTSYPNQFVCSQNFTIQRGGKDYQILMVFRYNEVEAGFVYYCLGEDDSFGSVFPVESYSLSDGVYTVVVEGENFYLKIDGKEYVYCDENGNTVQTYPQYSQYQ